MNVPFLDFDAVFSQSKAYMHEAVERIIANKSLILGPELDAFERAFADYCGVSHCIGVGNGLDALALVLRAMSIGPGDEVIVPSQTFIATWLAVSHVGALPVEVDVEPGTTLIAPDLIEAAITPRTRAIIPVHLYGQPAEMDAICDIARRHGLFVLEDAAQAHGARYRGRRVGGFGGAAAFSFYPTKNLGACGDAGAVVTDNADLAAAVRRQRNYGSEQKYVHVVAGHNSRLDEFQACVLNAKLRDLDRLNAMRQEAAAFYHTRLAGHPNIRLPETRSDREHVYHLFVVQVPDRDRVLQHLRRVGIDAAVHYPTIPGDQEAYAFPVDRRSCATGRRTAQEALSLPFWPGIEPAQQEAVVSALFEALGHAR